MVQKRAKAKGGVSPVTRHSRATDKRKAVNKLRKHPLLKENDTYHTTPSPKRIKKNKEELKRNHKAEVKSQDKYLKGITKGRASKVAKQRAAKIVTADKKRTAAKRKKT